MRRLVLLENATRATLLGDRVRMADRWWLRLKGLLGAPPLEKGEGLVITPCRAVHMVGMRRALDVLFLDREMRVVALHPGLLPGSRTRWNPLALHAVELPEGMVEATGTRCGDRLVWSATSAAVPDQRVPKSLSPASPSPGLM